MPQHRAEFACFNFMDLLNAIHVTAVVSMIGSKDDNCVVPSFRIIKSTQDKGQALISFGAI